MLKLRLTKKLRLVIAKVSVQLLSNVDSNRKNNMKLKLIKDRDGNPEALLTNPFKLRNCQKHNSLIATLYAPDFRMSSLRVTYSSYAGKLLLTRQPVIYYEIQQGILNNKLSRCKTPIERT